MNIVDLSTELAHHMVRYPSSYLPEVQLIPAATHEKEGRAVHILTTGTHVSTHIDAPFHAIPNGKTIDQIPPHYFVGVASIVRIPGRNKTTPLDASDFKNISQNAEKIIFDTGWASKMWGTKDYFTEGPFLTQKAAELLASLPNLHLLGMDFPNIDSRQNMVMGKPAPNHQIILGRDIILLENLINLEKVDEKFWLSAAPPKLVGGDGCPCRALALFPISEISSYAP